MISNPLIQRYRYSTLRPKQLWVYVTIYFSIIFLLVSINYTLYKYQGFIVDITQLHENLYYQFLTFQIVILFFWSAYNSGSAIKEEMLNKSFDFFRLYPIPPHQKALGIIIGKNLLVFIFAAINFLLLIYFGIAGRINVNLQIQILVAIISITIFINLFSLMISINSHPRSKNEGIMRTLLMIFFLGPLALNIALALAKIGDLQEYMVYFFKIKIPILILISLIALYLSCWIFKGILRRFTYEQDSLFTRKGALLFFVNYILVVTGLYYNYLPDEGSKLVYAYCVSILIPVLIIPLGSLYRLDQYMEYTGVIQKQLGSSIKNVFLILRQSNLALGVVLFAIWAVSSIAAAFFANYPEVLSLSNLYNIFVLLTCYLFSILLLEVYAVYNSESNKIGLLLCFIMGLYTILPFILAGLFRDNLLSLYSPFGFISSMFFDDAEIDISIQNTFSLINALLCVFPSLFILSRYKYIIAQRQKM